MTTGIFRDVIAATMPREVVDSVSLHRDTDVKDCFDWFGDVRTDVTEALRLLDIDAQRAGLDDLALVVLAPGWIEFRFRDLADFDAWSNFGLFEADAYERPAVVGGEMRVPVRFGRGANPAWPAVAVYPARVDEAGE